MPWMEADADPEAWLLGLADAVAAADPQFERTVFVLQAQDWRNGHWLAEPELIELARQVRARGARHLAYYPDDFIRAQPSLRAARAMGSARRFPYLIDADLIDADARAVDMPDADRAHRSVDGDGQ
jgi:biofilm PGA synthesis lipoprotein PgaB